MEFHITLMEAIMLGGIFWLSDICTGYSAVFWGPTWVGLLAGIVLGDVKQALMITATIQPLYLAFTAAGGTIVHDPAAATIVGVTVPLKTGMDPGMAVTLAVPIGLLVAQIHTVRRIWFAFPAQMADKYAEKGNTRGIVFMGSYFCWISKFVLLWVPMTMMIYFGTGAVQSIVQKLPLWLTNGLEAAGGMLPALGFAMTVFVIGRFELLPYFLAGFFFVQYGNQMIQFAGTAAVLNDEGVLEMAEIATGNEIPGMALALIGLFLAFIHLTVITSRQRANGVEEEGEQEEAGEGEGKRMLDKKDVTKLWWRWWFYAEQSNSFSRLQSLAVCCAFIPSLKKLYGNDPELLNEGLKRHLVFFNTEGIWGGLIFGIVLAMEEQRALGGDISQEMITCIKAGLMGPIAGIGDTIDWSTLEPLTIMLFLPFVAQGYAWAPVAIFSIILVVTCTEGYIFTHMGYRMGTQAAVAILQSGMIQNIITGAGVLGLFMMGGLGASMVYVETPLVIPTGGGAGMAVQGDILDPILPGILTLLPIMLIYRYLSKGKSMMQAMFWVLGAGILLGCLGVIGSGGLIQLAAGTL